MKSGYKEKARKAPLSFGSWGLFFRFRNDNFVVIERGYDTSIIQIHAQGFGIESLKPTEPESPLLAIKLSSLVSFPTLAFCDVATNFI